MYNKGRKALTYDQIEEGTGRYLNPADIYLAPGYTIEVFAEGLDAPSCMLFTKDGDMLIADSGYVTNNPSVSRLVNDHFEVIADDFNVPLTGINYRDGDIYVSHRGAITVIKSDGTRENVLSGLPSNGDYSNSRVAFGPDGKMYFGQGTATNSGVVGLDNLWLRDHPHIFDSPGSYIMLNGQNFESNNILIKASDEIIYTGAFSPYAVPNMAYEVRKGIVKASGGILKANLDGSEIELVAWGFRNIAYLKFDDDRLFVSNNGCSIRGSRPIANAPDEMHIVIPGIWYGWPDYVGGEPVTLSRFKPDGGVQPEFLLANHPNLPPRPFADFTPGANIVGFDFNPNNSFGQRGDVYIAEFGSIRQRVFEDLIPQYSGAGHRISKIDIGTRERTTFAINRSGFSASTTREGGFGRPIDLVFGPDDAMYVVDMGLNTYTNLDIFIPNTGVIWKITKSNN